MHIKDVLPQDLDLLGRKEDASQALYRYATGLNAEWMVRAGAKLS